MAEGGKPVSPASLTPEDAARLLAAAGGRAITAGTVRAAIAAGAPTLPNGRINLVELMAWLEKEMASR